MSFVYNKGLQYVTNDDLDIYVLLVNNNYIPNKDHDYVSNVNTYEVNGNGYARKQLNNVSISSDDSTDKAYLTANDVSWSSLNVGVISAAILYIRITNDDDSILFAYINDGGFPINTLYSPLTIAWNAHRIISLEDDS